MTFISQSKMCYIILTILLLIRGSKSDTELFNQLLTSTDGRSPAYASIVTSIPGEVDRSYEYADDISVPNCWELQRIVTVFKFPSYTPPYDVVSMPDVSEWTINIYQDNNGKPAEDACLSFNPEPSNVVRTPRTVDPTEETVEMSLSNSPIILTTGTYWISIQATTDHPLSGYIVSPIGGNAHVRDDPLDFIDWAPKPECTIPTWGAGEFCDGTDISLGFALYGENCISERSIVSSSSSEESASQSQSQSRSSERAHAIVDKDATNKDVHSFEKRDAGLSSNEKIWVSIGIFCGVVVVLIIAIGIYKYFCNKPKIEKEIAASNDSISVDVEENKKSTEAQVVYADGATAVV